LLNLTISKIACIPQIDKVDIQPKNCRNSVLWMHRPLGIALDLVHTSLFKPHFFMFEPMYSGTGVAKLHPLISFIPPLMSTPPIPRSLSQAKLPMKRKSRRSSSGLSLPVPRTRPTRSLLTGASSDERAMVRGVVGGVRIVVLYLSEGLVGEQMMWW